jgi:hypothetical protein
MVVLRRVELVWFDFGLVLHLFWALICLVVGLLPLWLMSGICIVVFLVYFRYISCVILTCPLANDQTPKLVASVSSKALFLGFVSVC